MAVPTVADEKLEPVSQKNNFDSLLIVYDILKCMYCVCIFLFSSL